MSSSTVTLTYSKPGTVPPVFVAGSFSSPSWEPQELDHDGEEGSGRFSKTFDLRPGTYQYKFRLGTGDWWAVDETKQQATDDQGNINNILIVEESSGDSAPPALAKELPVHTEAAPIFPGLEEVALGSAAPISETSDRAKESLRDSLSETNPAVTADASASIPSVSHELPTPPISEGGDDIDNKEAAALTAKITVDKYPEESGGKEESSRKSDQDTLHGVISSGWSTNVVIGITLAILIVPLAAWTLGL